MRKWAARIGVACAVLLLAAAAIGYLAVRSSLPWLDGQMALPGLSAPATIARDALGTATISARDQLDATRALGYLHAQERYFEMDLMRRAAAGELADLVGPAAAELDQTRRAHRMRQRAEHALTLLPADQRLLLRAYADGINRGVAALQVRPWAYLLLRKQPRNWEPVDSLLTGYAMYFDLQDPDSRRELAMLRLRAHLPPALFTLLARDGTAWDAPLQGQARGDADLPGADMVDLRKLPAPPKQDPLPYSPTPVPGSNNFAVAGTHTVDGRAIVANDMHLMLRAPNIWFRARLRYADPVAPDGKVDVQGFTLPGLPLVIAGSNGHVAWGFTNSYVGNLAWQPCGTGTDDAHCRSNNASGNHDAGYMSIHETVDGHPFALQWAAYLPRALDLDLGRMATSASTQALVEHPVGGIPAQNMLLTDSTGAIAWILAGNVPAHEPAGCNRPAAVNHADVAPSSSTAQRSATNQRTPPTPPASSSADGCRLQALPARQNPRIAAVADGRLWTANARVVDGNDLALVGDGGYDLGARAQQIRNDLQLKDHFDERDLLAIQLDNRAVFLQRWWALLREQAKRTPTPALRDISDAAAHWEGRASVDSVSYRIVRAWRLAIMGRLLDGLTAPAQVALKEDYIQPKLPQFEGVAWPLVTQRPDHLLSRRYRDWDALFKDAARDVQSELGRHGPLAQRNWGERNTAKICHPLAAALPLVGNHWLCMPPDPLAGDANMPRVAAPRFGASQRMVVAPGHETDGIIQMPGGQSGHPLSPFWGAGHADWISGRPAPFLPGPTQHTLELRP